MIRGAIFDVDGTLLDSLSIWDTVAEDYLRSLGIEPRENLAETFKTFSLEQSAEYCRSVYGVKQSVKEIMDGIDAMMETFYRQTAPLKPGVAEFLRALAQNGVKMAVATATDRHLIEAALTRCGVRAYFLDMFTCTSVGKSKNEPDIYRAAREALGTKKEDTWVFEDAYHAAKTAADDGFPVAALFDASEDEQDALKKTAKLYLRSFEDALPFREEMFR